MLVLSTRINDKILLPNSETAIEVVAIQSGSVRLGISAPEEVRVLREEAPECGIPWAPVEEAPTLQNIKKLIDKRLEIAREGLSEARQCLRDGRDEDARMLMEKIDEDLHLLRRRVRREAEKAEAHCGLGI